MCYIQRFGDDKYELRLIKDRYSNDGSLAVVAVKADGSVFCDVTKSIQETGANETKAYVNVHSCPWLPEFLERNGIAKPTGIVKQSGFPCYPLYEFDLTKLEDGEYYRWNTMEVYV